MKYFLTLIFSFSIIIGFSQNDDKDDAMKVVNQVFEAMRINDSTLLKSCFVDSPNMFTVFQTPEGKTNLVTGDFTRFVNAVGQPKDQVWNEPIWNEKVEIDGDLVSIWVDYAFYIDDQFSHCGVDAFHLVQIDGAWKIFHLVDTRRKVGCEIPDDIKP